MLDSIRYPTGCGGGDVIIRLNSDRKKLLSAVRQEGILWRIGMGDFAEIWAGKRFFGEKPVLGYVLTENIFPVRLQG